MPTGTNITGGSLGNGPSLTIPTRTTGWQPPPERRKSYRPPGWDRLPAEPPPPTPRPAPSARPKPRPRPTPSATPPRPRVTRTRTPGQPSTRRDDLNPRAIVDAYQAGATIEAIAREHQSTHATIRNRLIAAGVTIDRSRRGPRQHRIRGQYDRPIGPNPPTQVQREQAARFLAALEARDARNAAREARAREFRARDEAAAARRQQGETRPRRPLQQYDRPIGPHRKPGRPATGPGTGPARIDRAAIVASYTAGRSIPEAAAEHGVSVSAARRAVVTSGVAMRDDRATHSGGTNRRSFPPGLVQHAANLYADGRTLKDVARVLATGPRQAREALEAAGVTIRPPANERTSA